MLVVGRVQVFRARHLLAGVTRHVDVPFAEEARGKHQREDASFPLVVEDRLVRLGRDGTHGGRTEIVDAVHRFTAFPGAGTFATPIIALRVTSSASCSSLRLSVPAGRSGRTR